MVCKQWREDRVLGRFARHLHQRLGWTVGKKPDRRADLNYWMAFLEWGRFRSFDATPTAAFMTHLDDPEGDPELHRLYSEAAAAADLRVCMNRASRAELEARFGRTEVFPLPLELEHFQLKVEPPAETPVLGFSGYGYRSGRKGAELAESVVEAFRGRCRFKASGRRWPCPTKKYRWRDMPAFFRSLDLYACTALIEGGPMTTLEAMATGVPVVIPSGVGVHDEIPDTPGVFRYARGDSTDLVRAVDDALGSLGSVDGGALREATRPHSVEAWCAGHEHVFTNFFPI
jgi:glycosyltransferase involved in cell wall biosynthesis